MLKGLDEENECLLAFDDGTMSRKSLVGSLLTYIQVTSTQLGKGPLFPSFDLH